MILTDIINQTASLKLVKRILDTEHATEPIVNFIPQKKKFEFVPSEYPYNFDKNGGIGASCICEFIEDVMSDPSIDLHSIAISKNGKTVFTLSAPGRDVNEPHIMHSMSKSVTSLAIGILVSEGKLKLSEKLCDILDDKCSPIEKFNLRAITVEHLLTMSTGIQFNETAVYSDNDYVKSYFASLPHFAAGSDFEYNSLNTYMLGAIVQKISGSELSEFVEKKIFKPLGINNAFWEKCPLGNAKGGWGLYLSTADMLKIGHLYMNGGVYGEHRIVSEDWINEAVSKKINAPEGLGNYDYGYQVWVSRTENGYLFNGMFGQNIFCYKESGVCVAVTGGTDDLFQQSNIYRYVDKYFASPSQRSRMNENLRLKRLCTNFSASYRTVCARDNELQFAKAFETINGKAYEFISPNRNSTGIMPFIVQCSQNNYTKGIEKISFEESNGTYFISITESGVTQKYRIGFKRPCKNLIDFATEKYSVALSGSFALDEDGNTVLKLKMCFTELANTRYIKIYFTGDTIRVKFAESPELGFLYSNLDFFLKNITFKPLRETLINVLGADIPQFMYSSVIRPELTAKEIK